MVIASGGLVGMGEVRVLKDSRLVGFRDPTYRGGRLVPGMPREQLIKGFAGA